MSDNVNHPSEWVTIEEFPNYQITKDGKIRNKSTQKIRKNSLGHLGYPVVSLRKNGKMYLRTIHILLARTFIPNPENKPEVNHIDGNKANYKLENLEWVTRKENDNHARRTGLHKSDGDKPVLQYTKDMNFIRRYKSASEAARVTGFSRSQISNVARGQKRCKTCHGYIWKYEKDVIQNG